MQENEDNIVLKLIAFHFFAAVIIHVSWALISESSLDELVYLPAGLILFHLWTEIGGIGFPILPLIFVGLAVFGIVQTVRKIRLRNRDHSYIGSIISYQLLVSLIYSSPLITLVFGRYVGP